MTPAEIEQRVLAVFLEVAPDVEPGQLKREVPFRNQFDFDSMDTLNFAIGLHKAFAIEIPETRYRDLASLAKTVAFVGEQMTKAPSP